MKPGKKPFTSKVCPACNVEKPRSDYYKKGANCVSTLCKPCMREHNNRTKTASQKASSRESFERNKDKYNANRRKKYAEDPAYKDNKRQQRAAHYAREKEAINARRRERFANDPAYRATVLAGNKRLKLCTPDWVDRAELVRIYRECPAGHHVDHIIPIRGRIDRRPVSGLHVPWNLQYLTASDNHAKHCWITEDLLPATS